jgi:hypothetical protein
MNLDMFGVDPMLPLPHDAAAYSKEAKTCSTVSGSDWESSSGSEGRHRTKMRSTYAVAVNNEDAHGAYAQGVQVPHGYQGYAQTQWNGHASGYPAVDQGYYESEQTGNQYTQQRAVPQMMPNMMQMPMMPQMMPHMAHMMPQMLQQMREMQESMQSMQGMQGMPGMSMPGMPGMSMPGMPGMPKVMFVPVPVPMMPEKGDPDRLQGGKDKPLLESYVPGLRGPTAARKRTARRSDGMTPKPGTKKIFVGGLCPDSTADSLRAHFQQFGEIADCVVINQPGTKKCRGFGFVEFADQIPEGLFDRQHVVDQRRCGVKPYDYIVDDAEDGSVKA